MKEHQMNLVSIQESTFVFQEQAKSVEAKMVQADQDREQNEIKAQEDLQAAIAVNKDTISKIKTEADSDISAIFMKLQEVKDESSVLKSDGVSFKDTLTKYQEMIEVKLKEVDENTNKNSSSIEDVRDLIKLDFSPKLKDISETVGDHTQNIEKNDKFIASLQESFTSATVLNSQHAEKIKELEVQTENMDIKLNSLESADLFLQEAHRMLTDKTSSVESEHKRIETNVTAFLKEHETDIDNLKQNVSALGRDNNMKIKELDEKIGVNKKNIEKSLYNLKTTLLYITEVEASMLRVNALGQSDLRTDAVVYRIS